MRVIIESPFHNDIPEEAAANIKYARKCCLDATVRGEVPFASHLFFTQFLDDSDPKQREMGIRMGFEYWRDAELVIFYVDRGVSRGMKEALAKAIEEQKPFEIRRLSQTAINPTITKSMKDGDGTDLAKQIAELVNAENPNRGTANNQ